jgi:hypothetical protein
VSRVVRGANQLAVGSGVLGRRIRRALARWIRRGRRADLTGWKAVLGCIVRAGLLLLAAYLLARVVRALPALLWILTPAWCITAYRAVPAETPGKAAPEPLSSAPVDPRRGLLLWLLQTIGDRPGIHLRDLYPAMRQLPGREHLDDPSLRAALDTHGVPVTRSLRVGGIAGRSGVRRADVQALLSPAESGPGETRGDAGQAADSPALSGAGEWVESA